MQPKLSRGLCRAGLRFTASPMSIAGAVLALAATITTPAFAQAAPQPAPASDPASEQDIVVTAQRREESLQRVPVSISVLGGAALDRSTASGVTEALRAIPGVATLQSYQGGGTLVTIRGVTAGQALFNGAGTVAYYLDSVPFGAIKTAIAPDASVYDLQRVEVLRGPQGTLYGASAANGVVRILTAPADPSQFAFKARAGGGFTDGGSASYRQDVSANIPIVNDKLAIRATAGYQHDGGWIDNRLGNNTNSGDVWNLRLRALAKLSDRLTVDLSGWAMRGDFDGPSTGESEYFNSTRYAEPISNRFDTTSAKIAYAFDGFALTSATSYLDYRSNSIIDYNPLGANASLTTNLRVRVFTEELSLNSTGSGPWRWSVGGIYRVARENLFQALPQINFDLDNRNRSRSKAAFGELTREFADGRFELTAGVRYFHDTITQERRSPSTAAPAIATPSTANATTPRVVAAWHPDSRSSVYASYSQGFRSGFPQTTPSSLLGPARPDRLNNYELGAKGTAAGGLLSYDAAVFYIDWQHVQQNITVSINGIPFGGTVNGTSASGVGADIALALRPMHGLTLNGSFGINTLKSDADIRSSGILLFQKGGRLNSSPKYTATLGADYAFPLGESLTGRLAASAIYTSKIQNRTLLGTAVLQGVSNNVLLPKASFALEARGGWTATVYADNISNFHGITSPGFGNLAQYYGRARPRTIGLQIEYKYR